MKKYPKLKAIIEYIVTAIALVIITPAMSVEFAKKSMIKKWRNWRTGKKGGKG